MVLISTVVYIASVSYTHLDVYKRQQLGWLKDGCYLGLSHCINHIKELETYSWQDDKYEPEDRNDHTINASQYGYLPYKKVIGGKQ